MNVEAGIREALSRALASLHIETDPKKISLEFPGELSHGDYASNIAFVHAKQAGTSPFELAKKIIDGSRFQHPQGVVNVVAVQPGFINFYLAPQVFADTLRAVVDKPEEWGKNSLHQKEKIMVEYTDPNPFKEFHIGHLMSNTIGESIARLMEFAHAEVKRANYQGDVGPHVAKALWGIQKLGVDPHDASALGKAYAAGAAAYENDAEAKKEIDIINAKMYDQSDPTINEMYAAGREASLKHFENLYQTLGTKFDFYFFECDTAPRGVQLVKEHPDVFEESDGAVVYKGEQEGLHTRVFLTSRGTPTYEAKDLGLLQLKQEQGALDTSITITAHEQSDYFEVMLAAARRIAELQEIAAKTMHLSHGIMRFAEGKMSSRTGNVVTGEALLDDLREAARERATESRAEDPAKLSQEIAVAAIKFQILKQASGKDIVFDRERALSLEGDSGPYLQYTYARASQVIERAKGEGIHAAVGDVPSAEHLVRLMYRFPAAVERAVRQLEPHVVTNFLIEFAAAFNRWYAEVRIIEGNDTAAKVAITEAARATLKNGLYLLGIPAPEKM